MTRNEAYEAMVNGFKINHPRFHSPDKFCFHKGSGFWFTFLEKTKPLTNECMQESDGYEIYKEKPKPKKLYAYRRHVSVIFATDQAATLMAKPDTVYHRDPSYDIEYPEE